LNVEKFNWSPDGRRIAYSASIGQEAFIPYMYTEIYVAEVESGLTRQITSDPGANTAPLWSPDGRWIAFHSQHGVVRWLHTMRIGLYDVQNDSVSFPAFDDIGRLSGFDVPSAQWSSDSASLVIQLPFQLSFQLFKLSIPGGSLTRFTTDGLTSFSAPHIVASTESIAYLTESFTEAPGIAVSDTDRYESHRIVDPNAASPWHSIDVRQLAWPSHDGQWTIHGWLLTPARRASGRPLPLVVYAEGGPAMVSPSFHAGGSQYPVQAWLANGVAILIPNSRGRAGFGTGFESAWETERDCGEGPLSDVLAGVDAAVTQGIVDPDRVALAGHSWGGYLAAYALTHTNRFRAILIHEAVSLNLMDGAFDVSANPELRRFDRQLGEDDGSPYEEREAQRLRDLSPTYQAERATTPSLLEFGADGGAIKGGNSLYQGLTLFGHAPTEFIRYPRTGHVTEEPALRYDSGRRDLEWFAYWVLGKPTQRMLDKYGSPKISEWKQ
jgi:dipeptidyl aminopeptidase/acylaminoacyl peptidase